MTEFLRILLPTFLCLIKYTSFPTSSSVRVEEVAAVVGSCGGTNSGISVSSSTSLFVVVCRNQWLSVPLVERGSLLAVRHW